MGGQHALVPGKRALITALAVTAGLGGCSNDYAVTNNHHDRIANTLASFLRDCAEGNYTDASRLVTPLTLEPWLKDGHPELRCAESLGVDPDRFSQQVGTGADAAKEVKQAFADAKVSEIRHDGDMASAKVELAGLEGETDLERGGTGEWDIDTQPLTK